VKQTCSVQHIAPIGVLHVGRTSTHLHFARFLVAYHATFLTASYMYTTGLALLHTERIPRTEAE